MRLLEAVAGSGVSGFSTGGTTGPEVFGTTDGFIDLDVSDDGRNLYQLEGLNGAISVYRIRNGGRLDFVQEIGGLPDVDTQGIVTVSNSQLQQQLLFLKLLKLLKLKLISLSTFLYYFFYFF